MLTNMDGSWVDPSLLAGKEKAGGRGSVKGNGKAISAAEVEGGGTGSGGRRGKFEAVHEVEGRGGRGGNPGGGKEGEEKELGATDARGQPDLLTADMKKCC